MQKKRWVSQVVVFVGIIAIGAFGGFLISRFLNWGTVEFRNTFIARQTVTQYLHSHSSRKLQIGAGGNNLREWLNTDIEPRADQVYMDAAKPFPVPDGSFSYIFSEHVIEHLTRDDGVGMLKECYRVLGSGGKIRIATPNLLRYVQLFREEKTPEMRRYLEGKIDWHGWPNTREPECLILNYQMRSFGHQFLYDPATLRDGLALAGFQMITEFSPGESDDTALRGIEARHNARIRDLNDYETMVFQAVRP
jgi:predicted SAM-dependent methyltransferase